MTSPQAIQEGTGTSQATWFERLDDLGIEDHTEAVRLLSNLHPELSAWWAQTVVVDWEQARGLRVEGQSCKGDFQVSVSKTFYASWQEVWEHLVSVPWLPGATWAEGATFEALGASIEVRRIDPGQMLRFWWTDADGKSTVEVGFTDKGAKCAVVFRHHQLPSSEARGVARQRWKQALALVHDAMSESQA